MIIKTLANNALWMTEETGFAPPPSSRHFERKLFRPVKYIFINPSFQILRYVRADQEAGVEVSQFNLGKDEYQLLQKYLKRWVFSNHWKILIMWLLSGKTSLDVAKYFERTLAE
jgi:hypothetical protein